MSAVDVSRSRPRPFWGDARFFLGLLLVVASVAGVWFVVASSRQTTPAFAAARTIVAGEVVTADDLQVVDVGLGRLDTAYLDPGALEGDAVATRTIEAGELVPQSAIGDADGTRTTSVVLQSAVDVPASVGAGSVVEVWTAPLLEGGAHDEPRILVSDASVVSVVRDDSMMGGGSASLELVIPRADVSATLGAVADGDAISVVPAGAGR